MSTIYSALFLTGTIVPLGEERIGTCKVVNGNKRFPFV